MFDDLYPEADLYYTVRVWKMNDGKNISFLLNQTFIIDKICSFRWFSIQISAEIMTSLEGCGCHFSFFLIT